MRRILIATGALGGGTAVAFALAAAAFLAAPEGRVVPLDPSGPALLRQPPDMIVDDGWAKPVPMPAVEPPLIKPIPLPPDGAEPGMPAPVEG